MRFWLGSHMPGWLEMTTVPLFISRVRLDRLKTLPRARGQWAMDSGGFTQLNQPPHTWTMPAYDYAGLVNHYAAEIGGLEWAAPQDWMCEPWIIEKTGLSVREHQERTVANYLELQGRGPFIPVLQGWTLADYETCIDIYTDAGVDLTAEPLVGLGTVCRRQDTAEIAHVVNQLNSHGLRLHGFGMKSRGVARCAHLLESADSMSWSARGRNEWHHEKRRLCGGDHKGGCANCLPWAMQWRERVVGGLGLFGEVAA